MQNPYCELSREELEDQLVEVRAERQDICRKLGEVSMEMEINNQHTAMLNQALGALTLPGNWELKPRFIPCHDDPFVSQELATVTSIYRD